MKRDLSYKNCLINSESFQLGQSGSWIPRYALTRLNGDGASHDTPSHRDRLDIVYGTEGEADAFALHDAMQWVDSH